MAKSKKTTKELHKITIISGQIPASILGTVIAAGELGDNEAAILALWPKFKASNPEYDSLFIKWLIKHEPKVFLHEDNLDTCYVTV